MELNYFENLLTHEFCARDTLEVTPGLLGCYVHRRLEDGTVLSGMIVESEAYRQDDPSCHAYKGCTPRSAQLFGRPAHAYVYLIYGMYHCFNIVSHTEGTAGGILIRALEPISPLEETNGPGRLCKSMFIDMSLQDADLTSADSGLWITMGKKVPKSKIVQTTRIGIKQAADYKWRFYIKDNPYVSVRDRAAKGLKGKAT